MKKTYQELKKEIQAMYDDFLGKYAFFAFDAEGFKEGCKKLNVSNENKITRLYGGGFLLVSKVEEFKELAKTTKKMEKDFRKEAKNFKAMLRYEMANHEYQYTYDLTDTLESIGMIDKYNSNKNTRLMIDKIAKEFKNDCMRVNA